MNANLKKLLDFVETIDRDDDGDAMLDAIGLDELKDLARTVRDDVEALASTPSEGEPLDYVGKPFEVNDDYVDSDTLSELREQLVQQRTQTAGHGRRARIQEQIDAIDRELDDRAKQRADSQ